MLLLVHHKKSFDTLYWVVELTGKTTRRWARLPKIPRLIHSCRTENPVDSTSSLHAPNNVRALEHSSEKCSISLSEKHLFWKRRDFLQSWLWNQGKGYHSAISWHWLPEDTLQKQLDAEAHDQYSLCWRELARNMLNLPMHNHGMHEKLII